MLISTVGSSTIRAQVSLHFHLIKAFMCVCVFLFVFAILEQHSSAIVLN